MPPEPTLGQEPPSLRQAWWLHPAFALALFACIAGLMALEAQRLGRSSQEIAETLELLRNANSTLALMERLEAGQRGYLVAGEDRFLAPYREAKAELPGRLAALDRALKARGVQDDRVPRLKELLARWDANAQVEMRLRAGGGTAFMPYFRTGKGAGLMDQIRTQLDDLRTEQSQFLEQGQARVRDETLQLAQMAGLGVLLLGLYFGIAARSRYASLHRAYEEAAGARRALAVSDRRFRTFMDNGPMLAWMKDAEGHYTFANRRLTEVFGWAPERILGATDEALHGAGTIARNLGDNDRLVMASGKPIEVEESGVRPDGQTSQWLVVKFPVEQGGAVGVGGVAVDITARKRVEAELSTRTAQLDEANRELEAFVYSVSHDLRAPLRAIDGFARALEEDYGDRLDAEGHGYLGYIRGGANKLASLIDDLLALSRISRQAVRRAPLDVTEMARAIAAELGRSAPERRVTWHIEEGMAAFADPGLVRVALTNLLDNAFKYTAPRPEAVVSLKRAAPEPDGSPVYEVADNGVGFDMAYAGKLFEPFQRLHATSAFPGSGVGLATVARVVRRHGGRIWAHGEPDHGARFFFTLGPAGPTEEVPR